MSSSTICLVQTHTPSYSSWSLISYPLLTTTNFPMSPTFVPSKLQTIAAVVLILSSSFFGVSAVPIDVSSASTSDTPSRHSHVDSSATNSSSPSRHSHMDAHENAKRADFLLGYTYVKTDVGTDYNAATQFTAVHFEEGPLGNAGEYLSPRPSRSHELKSGHTMECVVFAKKESVMKYGPIFVEAKAVNDQQKLEKYLAEKKFSPKSSVLIAHAVDAERKGELIMYIPGTFISTLGYDPARPAPAVDSLGFYVNCRPVEMMLYQPYKEISQWEELQPRLWVNGMTTMSTLKYSAH
ncbi:hypothetical protein C8R41DRAFT_839973 [Lentinula lateritia]|uniref:Uncharacterized protein n=1 Tax=Lentinula lateritia TaxID=40482 RepID=A0ABQ8VAN7_9AGAR|nr:hypothetical protein C8R41DRAFT_839973 [Lentinula lateritia]